MENRNEILKELREIAPRLALLEKINPYKVPEGYFMAFKDTVLQKISLSEAKQELTEVAPVLSKLNKQLADSVPANYFSSFSEDLIKKVRATEVRNELAEIAPELSKLQKANAYTVPAGYFNSFAGKVLKKIQAAEKPISSSVPSPLATAEAFLNRVFGSIFKPKYTTAFAGFATLVVIGMLFFIKVENCADVECRLAQLSNDDINTYLSEHPDFNSDQIFDENGASVGAANFSLYKEALQDVDDAALSDAIMD